MTLKVGQESPSIDAEAGMLSQLAQSACWEGWGPEPDRNQETLIGLMAAS